MTIIFALRIFFPTIAFPQFCKNPIRLPSFPAKPGRMISVGDFERTHTYARGYLGGNLERSYITNHFSSFLFFLLSRICGHRVRKSSSAIFCNSYPTRSRAPRIESHRLGKSSSVIFYNVCTLRSRACPSIYTYLPTHRGGSSDGIMPGGRASIPRI